MLPKLSTWFRITSAILSLPFFALCPMSFYVLICALGHGGPGGYVHYGYRSFGQECIDIALVVALVALPPFFGLFFVWMALGTPTSFRKQKPKTEAVRDEYLGPRCVSCREPIPPEAETCPKCGWTQPR